MPDLRETLRHGRGLMMRRDRTRLLLAFGAKPDMEALRRLLSRLDLALEEAEADKERGRPLEEINHTDQRLWIRSIRGEPIGDDTIKNLRQALQRFRLQWMGPVYAMPNAAGRRACLCPLPAAIMVKPARGREDQDRLAEWMAKLGWEEVREKSQHLSGYRYFVTDDPERVSAYAMRDRLQKQKALAQDARLEHMPMIVPTALVPNDPLWAQQWGMTQIDAPDGWDIETGNSSVVVCVLDTGCDLTHPDLVYAGNGINLDTMSGNGSPTGDHGTACAGIAAATLDNSEGVAGVAGGGCEILPAAFVNWTESEVAGGINYARTNGAHVISMSFGWDPWDPTLIDAAIQDAYNNGLVMCVATHNYNSSITYPATNPLVMACGASDQVDNRKTPSSPDAENWGSDFGPEMSVVAPGVLIPTTDRQGTAGYNTSSGTAGDYFDTFNGTSAATPHVAGLAALILSHYPTMTNDDVRNIIERTAERVGVVAYAETSGYPNGPWNNEMGYGRINVHRALDFADVMIRDYPGDTGEEPSSPPGGKFWRYSDIVIRITDDDVFVPDDPSKSSNVERGQTNYLYIRVTNNGPGEATNVTVEARITPWVGTQFVYPDDWTLTDTMHVAPTPVSASFPSIPVGGSEIAKFTISSAQVEDLWGWVSANAWHPCLLARTLADNDYAFESAMPTGGGLVTSYNNLAQRNLSVIDVIAGAAATFPFVAGHFLNAERMMQLVIDRGALPRKAPLTLSLDEDGSAFPRVEFFRGMILDRGKVREDEDRAEDGGIAPDACDSGIVFLSRARLAVSICCRCRGVLTLERGSRFDCMPRTRLEVLNLRGGDLSVQGGRRTIRITEDRAVITLQKAAGVMYPMALATTIPDDAEAGDEFSVHVAQRDGAGHVVGGAGVVFLVE